LLGNADWDIFYVLIVKVGVFVTVALFNIFGQGAELLVSSIAVG
jgi:hypothetical protein